MPGRRLIDLDRYFKGVKISKADLDRIYETFGVQDDDSISIEWLRKELYDMLYERKITSNEIHVFIELIARWRMRNG